MKTLIIFTKLFPYAKTEAFLESELIILSKYFDHIKVCPAYKNSFVREMPENVVLDNTYSIDNKHRMLSTLSAVLNGKLLKYFIDHYKTTTSYNDLKNLIRYANYEIYYNRVFKKSSLDLNNTIIYSYWFGHFVNSLIRIKLKHKLNFKLISRAHRWDIYEENEAVFPYRQHSLDHLTALYSISLDGKKYIEERYGNNSKIKVARLGVFDNGIITKASDSEELIVLSVSQITNRKRIFLLLDAVQTYATNNKNISVKWIHFGVGEQKEALEKRIALLHIPNLKIELKGYVVNTDIYKFYKKEIVDVFVNLSESEGVPVSIMEAQSFGIPVIATNVGGTSEIVNEEVGVLLSSNPNLKEVCKAIEIIVKQPFDRKKIKTMWNEKSNAEKNYIEFKNELLSL